MQQNCACLAPLTAIDPVAGSHLACQQSMPVPHLLRALEKSWVTGTFGFDGSFEIHMHGT